VCAEREGSDHLRPVCTLLIGYVSHVCPSVSLAGDVCERFLPPKNIFPSHNTAGETEDKKGMPREEVSTCESRKKKRKRHVAGSVSVLL